MEREEVPDKEWNSWRWQLRHRVTKLEQLKEYLELTKEEEEGVRAINGKSLGLNVTPYFLQLLKNNKDGPIRKTIVPSILETLIKDYEMKDPLGEEQASPVPGLVHRYPDRVLLLITDTCAAYCLTGDTKISLLDGTERIITDLVGEYPKKGFWVYSRDVDGSIVPGYAHHPRITKFNVPIYKIVLDNGEYFKCTGDHLLMKKGGGYIRADKSEGCSLEPLYRKLDKVGYEQVYENGRWKYTFHVVKRWKYGSNGRRKDVHHKNFQKRDNRPENLCFIPTLKHRRYHRSIMLENWSKPEFGEKLRLGRLNSSKWREAVKDLLSNYNRSPEGRERTRRQHRIGGLSQRAAEGRRKSEKHKQSVRNGIAKIGPVKLREYENRVRNDPVLSLARSVYLSARTKLQQEWRHDCAIKVVRISKNENCYFPRKRTDKHREVSKQRMKYSNRVTIPFQEWLKINGKTLPLMESFVNHKVVSVEFVGYENVYDLTVDSYHNFALSSGIFVHNCRYCTRRRLVGHKEKAMTWSKFNDAVAYIREHKEVRDVLVSGGDPLMLENERLEKVLKALYAIQHVEILRIGTKAPVTLPQRITPSLCNMLKQFHPLFISVNFIHPDEITPEVKLACDRLSRAGIPLGSQTVLLKGVNDDVETMKKLMHELLKIRVKPYYIYACDQVAGTSHFRTPLRKGIEIMEKLRGWTSGLAVPTFVADTTGGGGKVPIMPNYIVRQTPRSIVIRNYKGKEFRYEEEEENI